MDPLGVAFRTYTLSLSLSLFPAFLPILASPKTRSLKRVHELLRRELGPHGFAFAMTLAVAGGRALDQLWTELTHSPRTDNVSDSSNTQARLRQKPALQTFLANILSSSIAVTLLTSRRRQRHIPIAPIPLTIPVPLPRGSPTLDLTLLLFVRALDARVQSISRYFSTRRPNDNTKCNLAKDKHIFRRLSIDAIVFWLASSRIMWCFFYEPDRLPKSYVKWITSLAAMDPRLLVALRAIREGTWKYSRPSVVHGTLLTSMASELNFTPLLGDPHYLPAHGGKEANKAWAALGFKGRRGVGGIPCDIVHCGVAGNSCTGNALLRGVRAFGQALLIYAPVHILPAVVFRSREVLNNPRPVLLSLIRSASFLSAFVSSVWFTVCFVRTLFVARLFPRISHNFFDGPQGCILAGCLVCGSSIGIEKGHRRGEMALYVLPRAIRAVLPDEWLKSGGWGMRSAERLVFVLSLASILTTAIHQPETLRGLSRWIVTYIMSGTSTTFWKRRRGDIPDSCRPNQDARPERA